MNTTITKIDPQKVHLLANISKILRETKKNVSVFPSGRRISAAHKGVMHGLVELWIIHYTNTGSAVLRTNRGNLADAMMCSERSTYNYMKDFNQLDILQWKVITEDDRGWIDIELTFLPAMFAPPAPMGERATDGGNAPAAEPNGVYSKVCRTHYTTEINNIENSRNSGGRSSDNAVSVQKIEAEQKKEKQGQQKPVKSADVELNPNFCKKFRAAADDDRKTIQYYANRLWEQAKQNLWKNRHFRKEVDTECVQNIAVAMLHLVGSNNEKREEMVKTFYKFDNVKNSKHQNKSPMLQNFLNKQETPIASPLRDIFSLLSRAIEIQRENCQKRGYQCYYPTHYLSTYFHIAIGYAQIERRTITTHHAAGAVRLEHSEAKIKLRSYVEKGIETRRKFDITYTLDFMRGHYIAFRAWLETTQIQDKQIYLTRFVEQMNCLK